MMMYVPFILLCACLVVYMICRRPQQGLQHKLLQPLNGEDAIQDTRIVGVSNSVFTVSRYLRSVRNYSSSQWITVAVNQVIRTNMGTTIETRLLRDIAPGEERRLGHADEVKEGKYHIYIGYEIVWARYTPAPHWHQPKSKRYPTPREMYDEVMKNYRPQFLREMEEKEGRKYEDLWP
ncbi:hypothetical protein [Chitinophaga vietnamensis]|uniref:hypothetical protein n=1 Tax=Chitinophaga vietnamensis TaxID=2593957 RepID=UPI0011779417|nr:hypothetical protein [Chitinophaga vietnamensis]